MTLPEEALRWIVVGAGAVVVAGVALWSRRAGDRSRVKAVPVSRDDLAAGVHFFSSGSCAPCTDARKVIDSVTGGAFAEIRFEDDPARFGGFRIARVPAVIVMGSDRRGLMWEGVPGRGDLRRAILERSLPVA
jgi:hypothetical protein